MAPLGVPASRRLNRNGHSVAMQGRLNLVRAPQPHVSAHRTRRHPPCSLSHFEAIASNSPNDVWVNPMRICFPTRATGSTIDYASAMRLQRDRRPTRHRVDAAIAAIASSRATSCSPRPAFLARRIACSTTSSIKNGARRHSPARRAHNHVRAFASTRKFARWLRGPSRLSESAFSDGLRGDVHGNLWLMRRRRRTCTHRNLRAALQGA